MRSLRKIPKKIAKTGLLGLSAAIAGNSAHAYPTYQRLGYISCTACHFSPQGGGLLTPYGQSIGATLSAFSKEIEPADEKINQGIQARLIDLSQTSPPNANPFLMQADYLNSAFVTKNVRVDTVFGAAIQQGPNFLTVPGGWDDVLVRRLMVNGIINDDSTIQVGRDYYPQGLNIDDHTSFLKMDNKRNVTDYPTQVRYVHQSETLQLIPYLYGPSYEETPENQESGAGGRAEYALANNNSVGGLLQFGDTPIVSRSVADGFVRLSNAHWDGLVSEYVFTRFKVHSSGENVNQSTWYVKPYVAFPDWIETGFVYEYLNVTDPHQIGFQYGPSLNIRIVEWFSLLGDGRNLSINGNAAWNFYGQAFLHLQI
jgi:hypothetical protein